MEDTSIENSLKTVETLYQNKDYSGALKVLQSHQSEIPPGLWHYNVGTMEAGLKNWTMARYHLLKAEKEGFSSKELTQNLDLVESQLEVTRLEKPLGAYDYVVKGALLASSGILTSLALLILVVGLFNLRNSKSLKALSSLALVVLAILGINWWIRFWPHAIVVKPQMIYDGPSAIFAGREEIPAGVMVIPNVEGEWVQVKYPSRFSGWIKKDALKEL